MGDGMPRKLLVPESMSNILFKIFSSSVFFDAQGNGFVCLNSGTSERRTGHLAMINRDLIGWAMKGSNR